MIEHRCLRAKEHSHRRCLIEVPKMCLMFYVGILSGCSKVLISLAWASSSKDGHTCEGDLHVGTLFYEPSLPFLFCRCHALP